MVDNEVMNRVLNCVKVRVGLIESAIQEGHTYTAATQIALLNGFILGVREGLALHNKDCDG